MNDTWGHIDRRPAFGLEDSLRRRGDSRTTGFQPGDDNGQDARRPSQARCLTSDSPQISQICADFSGEKSSHQGHKGHKDVGAAVSAARNSQRNLETRNPGNSRRFRILSLASRFAFLACFLRAYLSDFLRSMTSCFSRSSWAAVSLIRVISVIRG